MDDIIEDDIVGSSTNATRVSQCEETPPKTPSTTVLPVDTNVEIIVPKVGMAFESAEDAKSFYSDYAERMGFEIIRRTKKQAPDGSLRYIVLACSRQGSPKSKTVDGHKSRKSKRMKCSAKITVSLSNKTKLWHILSVSLDHIHAVSPSKSRLFPANRHISMEVQRTLLINDEAGVKLNKSYRSLIHDAGGFENVPFVERDLRNFVAKERRLLGKDGDGQVLLGYFSRMQKQNNSFFYDIDLDDEFHVRNVFWADARTRAAYESFGDVITFDTTYLTNKYDMPFAPFVGVNHHGQSTLLGCGLVSSEDTTSFVWLFQSFLRCMSGKAPIGIITDQCRAMQNAINIVFPNARHRWCLWHIMNKIPEKFARYEKYKEMKRDMKVVVYDSLSVADFQTNWVTLGEKFGLNDNDRLNALFEERARWVPIYLKQYFWAGMSTTQRSESVNAFFDGYINSKMSLAQFVRQYDNALHDKAEKEYQADFWSSQSTMMLCSPSLIEKQFQREYTHAKFMEVQTEF